MRDIYVIYQQWQEQTLKHHKAPKVMFGYHTDHDWLETTGAFQSYLSLKVDL
jgi:hypothetical protein